MTIQTPEPNIEVVLLPEAPAIPFEIAAEIEFGLVRRDAEQGSVSPIDRKLHLLRHDERRTIDCRIEQSRHRTEVAAGADEHRRPGAPVDHPVSIIAVDAC